MFKEEDPCLDCDGEDMRACVDCVVYEQRVYRCRKKYDEEVG
jgi:hypothetical protein